MSVDLRGTPSWKQRAGVGMVICGLRRSLSSQVRRAELELHFNRDRRRAARESQEEEREGREALRGSSGQNHCHSEKSGCMTNVF